MQAGKHWTSKVMGEVTQLLPSMGLAYLAADDDSSWVVTKSTSGSGLVSLEPGKRVAMTVTHHPDFSVVSAYAAVD